MPLVVGTQSHFSLPIVLANGEYFGDLCAMDRHPRVLSDPQTLAMFRIFADLIARQLDSEDRHDGAELARSDATKELDLRALQTEQLQQVNDRRLPVKIR